MGLREIVLGAALIVLAGCATASAPPKARELTLAERASVSETLEPLLTAAKLWRGPDDGCAAAFGALAGDTVGVALTPHAPCRVRLVVIEGTLTRVDRATLRALLAHELAHMQLGHPDARQARAATQKETQKGIKTASGAVSKAVGFIPGIGGLVSKGVGVTKDVATAAMEMRGTPYLREEEQAADEMAAALLNEGEASGCRALSNLLEERLRAPDDEAWVPWQSAHPVSKERIEALAAPCPGAALSARISPEALGRPPSMCAGAQGRSSATG